MIRINPNNRAPDRGGRRPSARRAVGAAGGGAGFVLPMILFVVAVLSLGLWAAASIVDGASDDLAAAQARLRFELAARSATARLAHLIATEPMGPYGLRVGAPRQSPIEQLLGAGAPASFVSPSGGAGRNEAGARDGGAPVLIRFDGAAYRLARPPADAAGLRLRIMDDNGLINLNGASAERIGRLLDYLGVEAHRDELAAALADYIDDDEETEFGDPERQAYIERGLRPPLNFWLTDAAESLAVAGWREALDPRQRRRLLGIATARSPASTLNLNTASAAAIAIYFGVDERSARQAVAERRLAPLRGPSDLENIYGDKIVYDEFALYSFPARTVRIQVVGADEGLVYETWITLARSNDERPVFARRGRIFRNQPFSEEPGGAAEDGQDLPLSPRLLSVRERRR